MGLKNAADKVWGFFGLKDGEFEFDGDVESDNDTKSNDYGKVTNLKSIIKKGGGDGFYSDTKMKIIKPVVYSDVLGICEDLKERKIVLINTTALDSKISYRMLDFLCGASYVLNAELQEIEKGIYVFVPFNIELTSKNEENKDTKKSILEWNK
ncbi:cell division protein SepF [Candidatus Arthromitus sp. SFB-rat-Yit]|uniref:cell division protein SepF n=1 Tax=Candidatus Arthromitus sp. SFB-rat-Yit TaxID=1041504 RepID=UPI000227A0F6|nr:cell division protein SepF [Candidatus Arthromitus sp. SFB-rat-Yit]BAK81312.1 hypothetical protein RATSFB_0750 [Candidatus Arthromitus sp. SFB-rat-Yit]